MFIKRGRSKALAVQAIVRLLAVSLSINLLIVQMTSGGDAVADNNIGAQSDNRRPTHEEELSPHYSQHDSLRERMEAERGYPRSRDEYLRYHTQRMDKNAGRENPGCLPSAEEVADKGAEGAHTTKTTWAIESADAPKHFYSISSKAIAVDTGNHPHIAYGNDHLYYAYHDGATWHYETADASFDVGCNAAIALDTSGHAHISYQDTYYQDLKYATNASGAWITTTVDSYGYVGFTSSIAIDASGHVHISYSDDDNYSLKYATNASGAWVTATVGEYISDFSIAVDSFNHAHISYKNSNGLGYTTNASGSWVTTMVDNSGKVGFDTSLKLDSKDHVHISYDNITLADLMYATGIPPSTAITRPATRITKTSATLNATINANRLSTQAWFKWGYLNGASHTYASPKKTFSGAINQKYSYKVRELNKKWPYYFYRVVAENEDGIFYGEEMSFEPKR